MTRLDQTERTALCDIALQVGEDQPTLCGDWTVKDLVVHLLVREGGPAAAGIVVPALSGLTDRASQRLSQRDFATLVERLRHGPPRLSPFALPKVGGLLNTLEYFVHHEDVRRAQPGWAPRDLSDRTERTLWAMLKTGGKAPTRGSRVGVAVRNSVTGRTAVLHDGPDTVTATGLPSELVMFAFGRTDHARVDLDGDPSAARLGI